MIGPLGEKLRKIVEIDSPTSNQAGIRKVLTYVKSELEQLGFTVEELFPHLKGDHAPLLLAKQNASQTTKSLPKITLVTHADTVFESASGFKGFALSPDQKTATGPGVIDDKGGIIVALAGLQKYLDQPGSSDQAFQIQFICSPSEETGSQGFHDFLKKLGTDSWMALGFEPALESGDIIQSRRGNRWYRLDVSGHEAHSGRNPEDGINAAHELAHKIVALEKIGNEVSGISIQTGTLQGGSKTNIVCGHAQASVDFRFPNFELRDEVDQKIRAELAVPSLKANSNGLTAITTVRLEDDCPPVEMTDGTSQPWIQLYLDTLRSIEKKSYQAKPGGGAADVNYMSHEKLVIIDGLGPIGYGIHQATETILLDSLETRSDALAGFLEQVRLKLK